MKYENANENQMEVTGMGYLCFPEEKLLTLFGINYLRLVKIYVRSANAK
jgi:hypothetical protein